MEGFIADIEERTEANRDFRHVLFTGPNLQLVLMSLAPGEDIGEEVHEHTDQFFRVESGRGEARVDSRTEPIEAGTSVVVPAGTRHNIRNTGRGPLKLYTIYAPPEHAEGTVHRTRADAEAARAQAGH